jgi:hypothetical protein
MSGGSAMNNKRGNPGMINAKVTMSIVMQMLTMEMRVRRFKSLHALGL